MRYYQVLPKYDNTPNTKLGILVKGELFTAKEMEKYNIPYGYTVVREVCKHKTYFSFGARFYKSALPQGK